MLWGGNFRKRWRIEWTEISSHDDFGIITMDELPSVIPKAIIEVLNRLENDEANRFSWKLTRSLDSLSLTVSCKFRAKTSNKAKDDSEVTGRVTVNPVKCHRKKKKKEALPGSWGYQFPFSPVPQKQNIDFLCSLFPKIAFVPHVPSFFWTFVPLKNMISFPCSPKPLGRPQEEISLCLSSFSGKTKTLSGK